MYISKDVSPMIRARINVELRIVRRVITDALAAGYQLSVDDGEERFPATNKKRDVYKALYNTDEDMLFFVKDGATIGWVRFIYGNGGWDVINDYTTNLESVLAGATALAEKIESGK